MLLVREVFSDWTPSARHASASSAPTGSAQAPPPLPAKLPARSAMQAAGKTLVTQLKTFLAFPEWFYLKLPVNTMTEPRLTPGGLATQYSSAGHYELGDDQALIITVPVSDAPYQGFQLGTMWYLSMDFVNHQTSLTAAQAQHDPDGMLRFVVSERDPGVANWLECTGHRRGYLQIRWQRTSREFTAADGPTVEVVRFDELPDGAAVLRPARGQRRAVGRAHRRPAGRRRRPDAGVSRCCSRTRSSSSPASARAWAGPSRCSARRPGADLVLAARTESRLRRRGRRGRSARSPRDHGAHRHQRRRVGAEPRGRDAGRVRPHRRAGQQRVRHAAAR